VPWHRRAGRKSVLPPRRGRSAGVLDVDLRRREENSRGRPTQRSATPPAVLLVAKRPSRPRLGGLLANDDRVNSASKPAPILIRVRRREEPTPLAAPATARTATASARSRRARGRPLQRRHPAVGRGEGSACSRRAARQTGV